MPGGDGTGPNGLGGWCTPIWTNGQTQRSLGFGRGFRGRGRGCRNMFYATGLPGWMRYSNTQEPTKEQELQLLEQNARSMEEQLKQVRQRIEEFKKEG